MMTMNARPVVLCFAGLDPSGGAGLQADIEAVTAQGCHAATAATALTLQDTCGVEDFRMLDRSWIAAQAQAVLTDMPVAAVKLGMLGGPEALEAVVEAMQAYPQVPMVCDPVLRSGGGAALSREGLAQLMVERLLPQVLIATPNLPEARMLAELPEGTTDDCAQALLKRVPNLLITGGHEVGERIVNRLYLEGGRCVTFPCPRLPGEYHGSGCTLSSALAARLALGELMESAVRSALDYCWRTLRDADCPGRGQQIPRRLPLDFCQ